jgi:class 3 adenylate cyclase
VNELELRYNLAKEMARYFLFHLKEELKKPEGVVDFIALEGISFRQITEKMINNLIHDFPDIEERKPSFNLFKQWWKLNFIDPISGQNPLPYNETTFKLQNQTFAFKIADIKKPDPLRRKLYQEKMSSTIKMLIERGRIINFEVIFSLESRMYPLLEVMIKRSRLPFLKSSKILYEQNSFMQKNAYRIADQQLRESFQKTDDILKSIFPENVAEELKSKGKVEPKSIPSASILFCDLVGFTNISSELSPHELLAELDECYTHFDKLVKICGLEKIKTIGDTYMAASGIDSTIGNHSAKAILCALKIQEFIRKYHKSHLIKGHNSWKVRIGIHTGSVVAGVLGLKRFNFDIWGDAVNIAQRMEANGIEDRVNVSQDTYYHAREFFEFTHRGKVLVKGKGEMDMYFADRILPELSINGRGKTPTNEFITKVYC